MATFYDLIFNDKSNWDKELLITNVNRYSLHDLHAKVEEFMTLLQAEGDLKGKKVAALIPNLPVYFSLLVAVNKLGGTFIPLSHQFRSEDLTNILNLTRPHIVFTVKEHNGSSFSEMISKWAQDSLNQLKIFSLTNGIFEKELIEGNKEQLETENIDIIASTSGSTGVPKGIKLNVDSIYQWTKAAVSGQALKQTDHIFLTIPITAPYGICWLLTCFHNNIQMVISESFDMPLILNLLKENPCNKIASSPSIFKGIYLFAKNMSPEILENFEVCTLGGEPVREEFISLMSDLKTCKIFSWYGLSEQGIIMHSNDIRSESLEWSVFEGYEYKVNDVSSEGIGELLFKTSSGFQGYYQNEQQTKEVLTNDGWFHTGDLAQIVDNERIEIVGRIKQMIKKGGVQIIPGEIERVLEQHLLVSHSAVVGVPHSVYGEEVVAFVVAEDNLLLDDLYKFVRNRLANFKVPDRIITVNEMPIIQGKLDKVTLRNMAINSL
jgi:long-chain acyl-CoA synthetase